MVINNFVTLTSFCFNLIIALVVFLGGRKKPLNKAFALYAFLTAFWVFTNLAFGFNPNMFLMKSEFASASLTLVGMVIFVYVLSGKKIRSMQSIILCILGLILFFTPYMGSLILEDIIITSSTNFKLIPSSSFYPIYIGVMLLMVLWVFQILAKGYRGSVGLQKLQIKYMLVGMVSFMSIGFTYGTLIMPYLHFTALDPIDANSSIIYIAFSAYAIVKHRLMDIRLLVLKSVAYTITLTAVTMGYIAFTVFVLKNLETVINPIALNMTTLLALVFTFNPLRTFFENHTNRIFAKGHYNFNELLGEIGEAVKKNSRSVGGLTNNLMQILTSEMHITKAAFVITNSPTLLHPIRTRGFSRSKTLWNKPTNLALKENRTIVYDELEEEPLKREILDKVEAQVLVPIKTEQATEAILVLGEKDSGDMYTSQDLRLLELAAPQIAIAVENARSFKEKEQRIVELQSINKMFQHIEHFLDLDRLLQGIVDEAINVTGAEGGSLMLLDKNGKSMSIKVSRCINPIISLNAKVKIGEGIAGIVAKTRKPLILNGSRDGKYAKHLKREEIISAISVPMIAGNKLVGVLNINRETVRMEFTEENINVMSAFAAQAAEAITKAGYFHQIEQLSVKNDNQFKEFTRALAKTVDAKDPYTYGHSEAVTRYAVEIAKEMKVGGQGLRTLEIGGRLHDMGKIGIPEHILNKPAGLTDDEYLTVQRHPEIGAQILKDTSSLKGMRDLILYHHERFDGKGYPTGLKGKDIPLLARILAVADSYDAMVSQRAYRKGLPRKDAITEIKKCSGSQFDPEVVKAFLSVMNEKRFRVIKNTVKQIIFIPEEKKLETS